MPEFLSDPDATARRIATIRQYMDANVLGPNGFCCRSFESCRRSALYTLSGAARRPPRSYSRGQMSHVGLHYDITESGKPWRVMLIAMEVGREWEMITLDERRLDQDRAINVSFRERKPHMKGTTSALRAAFGRSPGLDRIGELLDLTNAGPQHIMSCYALVNLRLCSAVEAGTTNSKATDTMSANCLEHLVATVRALEPTLCVLQSVDIRKAIAPVVSAAERISAELPLEFADFAGVPTVIANFPHPYQRGRNSQLNWATATAPYLMDVVVPTICAAREFCLS